MPTPNRIATTAPRTTGGDNNQTKRWSLTAAATLARARRVAILERGISLANGLRVTVSMSLRSAAS